MNERKDNIYIYLWEELNTVYIGRTIDPKRRHRQHKNRERERTYQFSSKYGIEHPPMIILEENLSINNGVEREKYWIKYYKENKQYIVLNKSNGGELGSLGDSNEEKRKEYLREYYRNNKEKYIESGRKYRQNHLEKIRERNRIRYYKKHLKHDPLTEEEKKKKQKEYYEKNKNRIKERYQKNKDKIKDYQKEYREKNAEKYKEYKKNHKEKTAKYHNKYRETHKEQIRNYNKKYRENHK